MRHRPLEAPRHEDEVPLKHQLVRMFWLLGPAFGRWADSHMDQKGLTPQRVRLMVLLKEKGSMMMRSLRNELGVTATNITALVDALEADGMVCRTPHPSDRRATFISLTPLAEQRLHDNCSEFKERVSELFYVFSEKEQAEFLSYLSRMKDALVERDILKACQSCKPVCSSGDADS